MQEDWKSVRFGYFDEQVERRLGHSLLNLSSKWFRTKAGDSSGHQSKWRQGVFPSVALFLA